MVRFLCLFQLLTLASTPSNNIKNYFSLCRRLILGRKTVPQVASEDEDEDVVAEHLRVSSGAAGSDILQVNQLTKVYQYLKTKVPAVKKLSVGIPAGEVSLSLYPLHTVHRNTFTFIHWRSVKRDKFNVSFEISLKTFILTNFILVFKMNNIHILIDYLHSSGNRLICNLSILQSVKLGLVRLCLCSTGGAAREHIT